VVSYGLSISADLGRFYGYHFGHHDEESIAE
jgi:hypothetical protein